MKRKFDKNRLLWIDLEMTGLDPERCRIIEVGVIITDYECNEIATYETVIHQPEEVLNSADVWVEDNMSELLAQSAKSQVSEEEAITKLAELIDKHFKDAAILSGNSIHQDRRFIRKWWSDIEERLHYRMLDVSSWKVYMSGRYDIEFRKKEEHRALADIRGSIEELQYYMGKLKSSQVKD